VARQMPSLAKALEEHETTRDAFNGWIRNGALSTDFSTSPGVRRDLTRENAIEIGFMAALARAGVDMKYRRELAEIWLRFLRQEKLPSLYIFDRDRVERRVTAHFGETLSDVFWRLAKPKSGFLAAKDDSWPSRFEGRLPTDIVVINLEEIVRRTDDLFDAEARD
jgi:hypothetical protein